jgi:4-amino-4-deoxy-L-arabinose transferase-like glycosyltransferase
MTTADPGLIERRIAPSGGRSAAQHLARLLRGRVDEAAWVRPVHLAVTALAGMLYLVNLTVSGYANTYYSAAALAASQSWSAWFFGSFDPANFITVDKPPLATMVMGLSVRLFGLSSWSILLPQALAGVATVAVLFVIVRRSFGPAAATIAAVVMALTPAAMLIFRFNNPDALLTLLLVLSAGALLEAIEGGHLRWVIAAASLIGAAFLTKYLQAYIVLPGFALTFLIAAPGSLRRRLVGLAAAAVTVLVTSGWWVAIVQLIPVVDRPFIGGSTSNSVLDLIFGYDGLARVFGGLLGGAVGGGAAGNAGGGGFSGVPGLLRLFNAELGGQIAWLLVFALMALASGLWLRRDAPRTDRRRAAYLLWGSWLLVTALVFSFMSGIIHSYYAVALAPAIAALVGGGTVELWAWRSRSRVGGLVLGAAVAVSALVAWQLLLRTPDFVPGLAQFVLVGGLLAGGLLALLAITPWHTPARGPLSLLALGLAIAVLLAGPAAYAVDTMTTAYSGGDPRAGPTVAGSDSLGGAAQRRPGAASFEGAPPTFDGTAPAFGGTQGPPTNGAGAAASGGTAVAGGPGTATADQTLVDYLLANRGTATWVVATSGAMQAGSLEIATGEPVMAMGGFTGSDQAPTLAQFKALVAAGKIRYVLVNGGGQGGAPGSSGDDTVSSVLSWVTSVGTQVDYGGSGGTLYDLSGVTVSQ